MSEEETTSPWTDDVRSVLGDEHAAAFELVDGYLREKWQPRMTQLEQDTAPARELWTDLNADPVETMNELFSSVYSDNPELLTKYQGIFAEPEPAVVAPTADPIVPTSDEPPAWAKPLVEDYETRSAREAQEAAEKEYAEAKAALRTTHADLMDADMGVFDGFVYAAGGNMERAYEAYKESPYYEILRKDGPPAEVVPAPPPVLGVTGAPAATPPVAAQHTKWDQLGDALSEHFAEQRASATPPPIT